MAAQRMSVVIPAYNAARTIRSAVASTLQQTRPVLEVIVVDDGSTDATAEVVAGIEDPRVRLHSRPNGGPAAARNEGIAQAGGELVGFLDSDDLWLPRYVECAAEALSAVANPGFAYTAAYLFRGDTGRVRRGTAMRAPEPRPVDRESFLIELLARNFVFTSAVVPAGVLAAVGGYDETLRTSEEYDLWLRILIAGFDPAWMGGPLALYREHAGQSSRQVLRMKRSAAEVYARLDPKAVSSESVRRVLAARREASRREVAIAAGEAGWASLARRGRNVLGALRKRVGLTHAWYRQPPKQITEAFGDLRHIDQA
jgi:hypothetical protein